MYSASINVIVTMHHKSNISPRGEERKRGRKERRTTERRKKVWEEQDMEKKR